MIDEKVQIIKDDEIDLRALFQVLWGDRKLILKITGFITFLGILYALLATPLYKSTITIYPTGESSGGLSQLQGMASMFGMNMGGTESTFHIPDIIKSRTLQTKIIYKKWDSNSFSSPIDLITFWEINVENKFSMNPLAWFSTSDGNMNLKWKSSALEKLSKRISVKEDKTKLIIVDVLMEEPELSAQIANYIYVGVVEFTNINHIETAKSNREFIQERQLEIKEILTATENKLKEFRSKNRKVMDSPQLQLEVERLLRDVEIQTQVFITLQQQYELARIEEVKETPSVVVLDKGFPSVYKDSPKRKLIIIVCIFLGGFFGLFFVLIKRLY
ncbi:MAG: hypothetical protein HN820_04285 [Candidatus Marinimicrobia bacterium]|jgi:uncharacterized protein involved in exopolysaccharide biosynthesis|nr:hypothetical protein [Candidatus Neomarinimicrobiota bacterium]